MELLALGNIRYERPAEQACEMLADLIRAAVAKARTNAGVQPDSSGDDSSRE